EAELPRKHGLRCALEIVGRDDPHEVASPGRIEEAEPPGRAEPAGTGERSISRQRSNQGHRPAGSSAHERNLYLRAAGLDRPDDAEQVAVARVRVRVRTAGGEVEV